MKYGINTLDDFDFKEKTVLCRIDINEPVNRQTGAILDTTRIKACLPTIEELSNRGAKVVLMAHQGSDIEYQNFYTTFPHSNVLSEMLKREVIFVEDVCGPYAREKILSLKKGQILLLDNVRYIAEEQTLFELKLNLTHQQQADTLVVKKLAPLADYYVCDAFAAAHRSQPSLCGFEQVLPSAMGRLFEKEYAAVTELMQCPKRPCTFLLGGSKVADAFMVIEKVFENGTADKVLTGGLVSNIFFAAMGKKIGLDFIKKTNNYRFIEKALELQNKYKEKIVLPSDCAYVKDNKRYEAYIDQIPYNVQITDIGRVTATIYNEILKNDGTVFVNGPMGVFEKEESKLGTETVFNSLAKTKAYTIAGGGDTIAALKKFGVDKDISFISTGGGALLQFLSGEELPVIKALRSAAVNKEQYENI